MIVSCYGLLFHGLLMHMPMSYAASGCRTHTRLAIIASAHVYIHPARYAAVMI